MAVSQLGESWENEETKKPSVEVFANFLSSHWKSHKEIETNPVREREWGRVLVAESESVPGEVFIAYEIYRKNERDCIEESSYWTFALCFYPGGGVLRPVDENETVSILCIQSLCV